MVVEEAEDVMSLYKDGEMVSYNRVMFCCLYNGNRESCCR